MVPIRLVLAVQEEQYIEPFLHYVHSSEFDRSVALTAFSRKEAFGRYLEESADEIDAVLGEAAFLESVEPAMRGNICWIQLEEGSDPIDQARLRVNKYQPLHQLLSAVLELVRGGKGRTDADSGRPQIIGVYSTVGGCGKTTVALNLARQLATEGAKVFYLNLETVSSGVLFAGQGFREGQRAGLARLLYDLKAADDRREPLRFPVSTYAYSHPMLQGDTFAPLDNLNELLEMERKDTAELIDYIAGSGLYDAVIVDMDSYPSGRTEAALERADQIVWIVTDDWGVMRKTGVWLAYLERSRPEFCHALIGKTRFVLNRYTGALQAEMPRPGLRVQATLSLIPAWAQGSKQGELLHSPVYQRDVMKLCSELDGWAGAPLRREG
ncbi:hypothetical protein [Paenibacillus macerans]|uniref:nucleotide-binding protein n=1 Tax=Paenibacillus macerans TaxID=44252 RepID=UPI003D322BB2